MSKTKLGREALEQSYSLGLPPVCHYEQFYLMPVLEWSFELGSVKFCDKALFVQEFGTGWSHGL